jgi:hypothetical protein
MAELSKFVKSRLPQQSSGGQADHLDANLLAAFAEQTLLERERTTVSAHLAQCADCREALALASAAQPVAERATAAPKRHWFLEWRWAGAAAAACCVIAVALQYRVQPPPVEGPTYLVVRPSAVAPVAENQAVQSTQRIASAPKLKVEAFKKALQLPAPAHLAQQQSPPIVMPRLDASAPEKNPPAPIIQPVAPPAPSEQANALLPSGLEPKALRAETADAVRLQKDLIATKAQSGLRPQANVFTQGMIARAPVAAARTVSGVSAPTVLWSINASPANAGKAHGVVERSLDAGKTWEVAPLSNEVSFRAVASAGTHVWAGGTNGALFHSADGGAHWEKVAVADDGFKLTGMIVNIDARDANLIKIATSSGEKWFSSDGGGRWKRQ